MKANLRCETHEKVAVRDSIKLIIIDNFIDNFGAPPALPPPEHEEPHPDLEFEDMIFEYFPDGEEDGGEEDGGEEEDHGGINAGGGELAVE